MSCNDIKLYYYDYIEQKGRAPADITQHIEQCPSCQAQIARLQKELGKSDENLWRPRQLELHYQYLDQWLSCETVRPFLPSLLVKRLQLRQTTPITAHVEHCPTCQEDLRAIDGLGLSESGLIHAGSYLADPDGQAGQMTGGAVSVLDRIHNRDVSNVLTRVRLPETNDLENDWVSDSLAVDVEHRSAAVRVAAHRTIPRRAVSVWITSGIAAAVLFALLLVLPTADLEALDIENLYTNLDTVRNVHIQKLDGAKVLENIWISEGLGASLFQQSDNMLAFVDQRSGKIYQQRDGTIQILPQASNMQLERPWGLLPFKHISQLPDAYEWEYISDAVMNNVKVRIYEWSWTEPLSNQVTVKRVWRGYLDSRTYLPYKIECLDIIGQSPAELIMEMKISYPTDAECREIFKQKGFGDVGLSSYGDQMELFSTVPAVSNSTLTEGGRVLSTWPSAHKTLSFPEE